MATPDWNNGCMSNFPFMPGSGGEDANEQLAAMLRQLGIEVGPHGEIDLAALMQQMQQRMGGMGSPFAAPTGGSGVDWDRTRQLARQVTASLGSDPTPTSNDQRAVADAGRLVDLWLQPATSFPELGSQPVAWSRAEWIENTMAAWQQVTDPIASNVAKALGTLLGGADQMPPEMAGFGAMLTPMLNQMAGSMYSMQLAQALGQLSTQVLTGTEIGMQLLPQPRVVTMPTAIAAFSADLDLSGDDVLLYLVLRESARQRLFAQVGWLAPQLLALIEHYAREIVIDTSALESAIDIDDMGELTPDRLMEASQRLQGRLFEPTRTPEQEQILARLETLVALVEGWVDDVTHQVAGQWMPAEGQLFELIRRRRGSSGPTEQVFKTLVGLELRPRRVREAAAFWAALREARGIEGRDQAWAHPDMAPDASALDDPQRWIHGAGDQAPELDDLDRELEKLLSGESGTGSTPGDDATSDDDASGGTDDPRRPGSEGGDGPAPTGA